MDQHYQLQTESDMYLQSIGWECMRDDAHGYRYAKGQQNVLTCCKEIETWPDGVEHISQGEPTRVRYSTLEELKQICK